MRFQTILIFVFGLMGVANGQYSDGKTFKHTRPKEFNRHFRTVPTNIDIAISQLESDLTEKGRDYFKRQPEKLAVIQFSGTYYMLLFRWKMHKENNGLVNYFIANGSKGDPQEIIRIVIAGLHRKLNQNNFTILELSNCYKPNKYKSLVDSLRNVNPKDTVFGSWYGVGESIFKGYNYTYSAWFEVVSKDIENNALKLKIIRLQKNGIDANQIKVPNRSWSIGEILDWKNGDLRNWKEVLKLFYSD
jgi:hypothetical protein